MVRISERELVLPALLLIGAHPGISTTELIDSLTDILRPSSEDAEILEGRSDTKFSQKVRNLVSHHTLDGPGLTQYTHDAINGYHRITPSGEEFLRRAEGSLAYIVDAGLDYANTGRALLELADAHDQGNALEPLPDGLIVSEGLAHRVSRRVIYHSRVLRQAAVEHYSRDGSITCAACGFDFRAAYGEIGEGFIEMHHLSPLFLRQGQQVEVFLSDAMRGLVPLCSNCHRMIHARRPEPYTVQELSDIVRRNRPARPSA